MGVVRPGQDQHSLIELWISEPASKGKGLLNSNEMLKILIQHGNIF